VTAPGTADETVTAPGTADGRCPWGTSPQEYADYHDLEWGRPIVDDHALYERLCLEAFQSGLSWLTILRKRAAFRSAFAGFDPEAVARFGEADVTRLLGDAGIVRHRGKIEAAIANAAATLRVQDAEGSLAVLLWRFEPEPGAPPRSLGDLPARTPGSEALARELRRYGFRFLGPTTVYAAMQAVGIVDDHLAGCPARAACEGARSALVRPR
jgi:DNA-3-methyladenine glycosylase I